MSKERLFDFALRALAARALSAGELMDKLRRRAAGPADVESVVARLREYGYLDDHRMASSFAAARRENEGYGKERVRRDLKRRQIDDQVAAEAIQGAYEGYDEAQAARAWIERKVRGNLEEELSDGRRLAATWRRLRNAGFGAEACYQALRSSVPDESILDALRNAEGAAEEQ